uniref:ATP-binding cassette sub-family B member 5 n=1 Tax=Petromyzon marinus TaxID=7757 RepID=A0AAJ7XEH4_PETMA|nr:ATP-dependent translocase ABCB1-like [Petromyzon marinus]
MAGKGKESDGFDLTPTFIPERGSIKNGFHNAGFERDVAEEVTKKAEKDKKDKRPKGAVGVLEVFRFADGLDVALMIVGLVSSMAHGGALPIMIIVFGQMTDSFVRSGINATVPGGANGTNVTVPSANLSATDMGDLLQSEMSKYAWYYVAIGCAVLVSATLQVSCWMLAAARQCHRIRHHFFRAILHQEMSWFDTTQIGELGSRLTDDINTINDGIGDKISLFMQFFSSFIVGFIIGFAHGWKLTLVILSVSPLLAICASMLAKLLGSLTTAELTAYAKAGAVAEEILMAIRTVVAFGGQQKAVDRYNKNLHDASTMGMKKAVATNLSFGLTQFIIFGSYALAFWYGTKLVIEEPENYTIGRVLIVFFSVLIGAFSLGQGAPNLESFSNARGAAFTVFQIIDKPRPIDSSSADGFKPERIKGDISFRNIHFSYPSRPDVQILKGLNLEVESGKTIALVGSSGCGKSTTIQLLQRFYDPSAGEVLVDGRDVRSLGVRWLREHIGVVSQEPVLFAATIGENIRHGREDASDADVERAAHEANAFDFISRLPEKFKTMVGERGAQLSGGQKQRIAIARALVRNPKILLLDEATSALDTESEAIVQSALDKARQGRTTIVIAHRLSTIRTADVIAGFNDGVVVEQGTHAELMERRGIYHLLVTQQTQGQDPDEAGAADLDNLEDDDDDDNNDDDAVEDEEEEEDIVLEDDEVVAAGSHHPGQDSNHGALGDAASLAGASHRDGTSSRRSQRTAKMSRAEKRRRKKKRKAEQGEKAKSKKELEKEEEAELPVVKYSQILAMNRPEWHFLVIGVVAAIVSGGVQPAFAVFFAKIIGVFNEPDPQVKSTKTITYSLIFLLLGAISFVSYFLQGVMFGKAGEILTMRVRGLLFKAILRQDISWFDDHKNAVGVLTTRLATDASQIKGATGARLGLSAQTLASLATGVTIAFVFGWQLCLLILALLPIIAISTVIRFRAVGGHANKDNAALENSGRISTEAVENIRTVVGLCREDAFFQSFVNSLEDVHKKSLRQAPLSGLTYGVSQMMLYFIYAVTFRFGAWLVAHQYMTFENVFLVFSAIVFSAMSVGQTSSFAPDFAKAQMSARRVFALLAQVPSIDSYSEAGVAPAGGAHGRVEFRDVRFRYPTRPGVPVLQGLSIAVEPGQTLALVGSSGCGKSTTVQLLERFYDPADGVVLLDGEELRSLRISWLRQQMGIVSQEPILFDCSISENIAYGDNGRSVSHDEMLAAAQAANIHNFIEELPDKYNTRVGDKGAQLSGGQKQRIAIARALVRNPKILLLDEATSALDTESEKIVQQALDRAREGRTCIVIAHRLSTIQNADIIAVIQQGRVVEVGTHTELLARQGAYHALVNAQVAHH